MNNNGFADAIRINAFREGLSHVSNGDGGQYTELINNITSLRRGILDLANDNRRNLNHDCGWPETGALTPESFRDLYDRDPIANRIVNLMPKECWQAPPEIYELEKGEATTPFEKSWKELNETVAGSSWHGGETGTAVLERLKRLDVLSGIGSFGVMLIGLDDGKRLDEPAEGVVDKVVGGIAFNKHNRIVDSWMSESEEKTHVENKAKPLNDDEKIVVNNWREQRTMLSYAVARVVDNQRNTSVINEKPDDGSGNPRSPKNMFSNVPSQTGSQQWFGTRFGDPEQLATEPGKTKRKVTFLRVFDESAVQVTRWEASVLSPRFGQPVMYRITFNDPRDQSGGSVSMPSSTAFVHWSRVLHVCDNKLSSESVGNSRLKPLINNVLDIRKIRGSSAEGYYQSCFPTLAFETHPQLGGDVDVNVTDLRAQIENLVNSLQRSVIGIGGAWKTLPPAVVDPTPHIQAGIEAISIQIGCPIRIFKGSERGELASSQDDSQWNDRIRERQNGYVTPAIIVPFIDRLILMGVLESPKEAGTGGGDVEIADDATGEEKDKSNPFPPKSEKTKPPFEPISNRRWVFNVKTNRIERVRNANPEGCNQYKDCGDGIYKDIESAIDAGDVNAARTIADKLVSQPREVAETVVAKWGYQTKGKSKAKLIEMIKSHSDGVATSVTKVKTIQAANVAPSFLPEDDIEEVEEDEVPPTEGELPLDGTDDTHAEQHDPGYKVDWPDLDSLGDKDRAGIAAQLTTALASYVQSGAADMMPLYEYLTIVWQMDDDEADAVVQAIEKHQEEVTLEQDALAEEQGFLPEAPEGMIDPEQRDMDQEVALEQAKSGGGKPGGFPPKGSGKQPPPFKGKQAPVLNVEEMDGQWITTDDGQHIFISAGGSVQPSGPSKDESSSSKGAVKDKDEPSNKQTDKYGFASKDSPAMVYSTGEYLEINSTMRNGKGSEESRKTAQELIKQIEDAPRFATSHTLWRGVPMDPDSIPKVGDSLHEKSFLSSSLTQQTAHSFAGGFGGMSDEDAIPVVYKMSVPKGSKGVMIPGKENEVLLQAGSKMKVKSVTKHDNGGYIVHVSVTTPKNEPIVTNVGSVVKDDECQLN